jgi:ABC-type Fe3+/spermidine/putrescine transport system ATPase subunit
VGSTNIFHGVYRKIEDKAKIDIEALGIFDVTVSQGQQSIQDNQSVIMSLRPEKIDISKTPLEGFSNHLMGTVKSIVYHGRSTQYNVALRNDSIVQVFEQNEEHFPQEQIDYDDTVHLYWQKENVVLLER